MKEHVELGRKNTAQSNNYKAGCELRCFAQFRETCLRELESGPVYDQNKGNSLVDGMLISLDS